MYLRGQAAQRGYAMAAVLISVAIMSIVMTALLPVWRQQMQREREAELVFRGEQYARAIYLYQRSNGGQYPPSVDALVQGRYLRKEWKDPTNGEEFLPLSVGSNQPGPQGGPAGQRGRGTGPGGASGRGGQPSPGLGGSQPGGMRGGGGIMMVVSQNKGDSIRIYNGASHYNEWRFLYNARGQRGNPQGPQAGPGGGRRGGPGGLGQGGPGGTGAGPGGPGQRGGPGMGGPGRRGGGPGRGSAQLPGRGRGGGA